LSSLVRDLGERALIERIRARIPPSRQLTVGIGDDAAIAEPDRGALQVLTTDALVEGVHFDRRFSSASDIGYKALAVNLSDIAAMGAAPRLALLSLMLPPALPVADVDDLLTGLLELAVPAKVAIAGGNITASPGPLVVDVTVVGSARRRKFLTRGGGKPGDALYVTGSIGGAAAGLEWLREHAGDRPSGAMADCVARHTRPEPRTRVGALLGRNRAASACMDLSDGLADAVQQVAAASGTGAILDAAALPIHPGAAEWWTAGGRDPVDAAVSGGDDYELLFAVPKKRRGRIRHVIREARGVAVTRIGELTTGNSVIVRRNGIDSPLPAGFTHFHTA
jgi:thiamine-monophosphate kinase